MNKYENVEFFFRDKDLRKAMKNVAPTLDRWKEYHDGLMDKNNGICKLDICECEHKRKRKLKNDNQTIS